MIIGLVLPDVPAYSETFFLSKIKGLKTAGHEVVLFIGKKNRNYTECKVVCKPTVFSFVPLQVIMVAIRFIYLLTLCPKRVVKFVKLERQSSRKLRTVIENLYLNSHILDKKLDWLHFGFSTTALRRENVAKAIEAKMATSLRGFDISLYPLKHPGCYKLLWRRIDKIHTISSALLKKAYIEGLSPDKEAITITPAIGVSFFKRELNVHPIGEPVQILTVARLKWVKGIEYTLEALAQLKKTGLAFRYTIVGGGKDYERLCFAAYQLKIRDWVHFTNKVAHEEVKYLMEKADIYLQYSIQEGFCNAVLEAQAMGLLCIVSNAGGLPENVLHEKTGWVVPKRKPELLARQIEIVLQMPNEELISIRKRAVERVKKEFNLEKQQKEFLEFYETD